MATTHVFAGLAAVAPVAYLLPKLSTPLAVGAILGGLAPDFDLVFDHRRTFHFPVVGAAIAALAVAVAVTVPGPLTAALAALAVAAWLHAVSDAAGSGPEMDPWNHRHGRAVYDHVRGRWLRPRRWIRYDGSPEDAALATALAVPALVVFEGPIDVLVLVGVALSIAYALLRRRLVAWLPDWLE
ncbi:metal-dependent hydrolase [Haloterrigena turkmenica]|nr:metal-dependent hydrolase [Haloterrigena turkmenica]